jgi:hypothetical protein
MPQVPQLLLYMFIAVVAIVILRELWRWILWFIHVHSWVKRRQRPPQGRVTMEWIGWKNRPGIKRWDD